MADFPPNSPNLHDGEHWLPADIRCEISFIKPRPEKMPKPPPFIPNFPMHHGAPVLIQPNRAPVMHNSMMGTMPNRNAAAIVNGLPNVGHGVLPHVYHGPFAFWNGGFPPAVPPGPIPMYGPIPPPQIPVANFDMRAAARAFPGQPNSPWPPVQVTGGEMSGFGWKSGGTGVFLPRAATFGMGMEEAGGTGVFISPPPVAPNIARRKKKSWRSYQVTHKVFVTKEAKALEKKEESQLPPEIFLPKDWIY
ncbi:hypothetical protein L1049_011278 [Liquidambar formosana]|uniref:Uncharacterized protein n=1 Tax=Liquidambar formosana TaxID=63359 RepID=A0AAP0RRF7_LIQFO